MNFDSFTFFGFALVAIAGLRLCPSGPVKQIALAIMNAIFLASFAGNFRDLLPLLAFIVAGYLAIMAASWLRGAAATGVLIFAIVAVFTWLKQYTVVAAVPALHFTYLTIGLSYILFRILHLLVDVAQDVMPVPPVLGFFNYTTSFLTFVSGPIQLYGNFAEQMRQPAVPMTRETVDRGLGRAVAGYVLLIAVAGPLAGSATKLQGLFYAQYERHAALATAAAFAAATAVYLVYLYVNFAAYMNIVIGIGRLAGFALPENFNRPYNAANFLDLWTRWHITLSQWFKLYLFNPLLKALAARWGGAVATNYLGATAFFVTFGVMGLWHGTTAIFAVYGVALGLGATVNKLWQVGLAGALGKDGYRALGRTAWYRHASRALTLAYFAAALTCLWIAPDRTAMFTHAFVWKCVLGGLGLLTGAGTIAAGGQQLILRQGRRLVEWLGWSKRATRSGLPIPSGRIFAWNAVMVALLVLWSIISNGAVVELVYKGY